jgi:uncharacterized protein YecE (DUF72 family)
LEAARALGPKLGPILVQLPPSLRSDAYLLADCLHSFRETQNGQMTRIAIEFRHASWFNAEVEALLTRFGVAQVIADSSRYPQAPAIATGEFVYLRFHGPQALFSSSYTDQELELWAQRIRKWRAEGLDVYAYFNNDAAGCAIQNARTLTAMATTSSAARPGDS